jgi:hypothetical protein
MILFTAWSVQQTKKGQITGLESFRTRDTCPSMFEKSPLAAKNTQGSLSLQLPLTVWCALENPHEFLRASVPPSMKWVHWCLLTQLDSQDFPERPTMCGKALLGFRAQQWCKGLLFLIINRRVCDNGKNFLLRQLLKAIKKGRMLSSSPMRARHGYCFNILQGTKGLVVINKEWVNLY